MVVATRSNTDRDPRIVLNKIFEDDPDAKEAFNRCGFKSRTDMTLATKNADTLKRMRWKDYPAETERLMTDEQMDDFEELASFFNWSQNCHGTLPKNPIVLVPETIINEFTLFKGLGPVERETTDAGGVVLYNPTIAKESEKRNKLGAYAPNASAAVSSGGNGLTTPVSCRSNAAKALLAFEKKIRPNEDSWGKFASAAEWTKWKGRHAAVMVINDLIDITEPNYPVPVSGTDDPDEVTLYMKKNTVLYMALQEAVETSEGLTIVKKHSKQRDGVAIWRELCAHYDDNIAAITRTKYLLGLICSNKIPLNHKGLAAAIDNFNRWVIEHNYFCKPAQSISDQQRLIYFERYIENIEELKSSKKMMDITEDTSLGAQAINRSAAAKIDFYYRQAQELDADHKNRVINARRKINASQGISGYIADEGQLWDMDVYATSLNEFTVNSATLESEKYELVDAVEEEYRYINVGDARRHGQMPKRNWDKLSREMKKMWLKFPIESREDILTCLLPPSPPSVSEEHRIPGTGVSSQNARATNAAESGPVQEDPNTTERSVNVGYIQAMRARSTAADQEQGNDSRLSMDTFHPSRLMSRQNKSSTQLVPINRGDNTQQRNASFASIHPTTGLLTPDALSNSMGDLRRVNMAFTVRDGDVRKDENVRYSRGIESYHALVDRGANYGLGNPNDIRQLWYADPPRFVNVVVAGGNKINSIKVASFAAKVKTIEGTPIILVFYEYGEINEGPTIHSKIQMGCAGCRVGDLPLEMGGTQSIVTSTRNRSFTIPITFKDGLPLIEMKYPSDIELSELSWVEMTRSNPWDPSIFDGKFPTNAKEEVPKLERQSTNETVVMNIKRRSETVFTDCAYKDMKMWEEWRKWRDQQLGEMVENRGEDVFEWERNIGSD